MDLCVVTHPDKGHKNAYWYPLESLHMEQWKHSALMLPDTDNLPFASF